MQPIRIPELTANATDHVGESSEARNPTETLRHKIHKLLSGNAADLLHQLGIGDTPDAAQALLALWNSKGRLGKGRLEHRIDIALYDRNQQARIAALRCVQM